MFARQGRQIFEVAFKYSPVSHCGSWVVLITGLSVDAGIYIDRIITELKLTSVHAI